MSDKCETFVARWDHAMCSTCGAAHAPTPTPAPGLDLDAVERDVAHLDGPHSLFDDRTLGRVLAVCNAAPALIAEVRALRAEVERLRADKAEAKRLGSYLATYITAMNDAEHPSGGFGLDELAEQTAAALEAL